MSKTKTRQPNYRKQLIQLAKFYGIVEIKNYFKSAKRLTNTQIELILIKNKIKLPLKKSLSKLNIFKFFNKNYFKKLYYVTAVFLIIIGFLGGAPHIVKVFHKIDSDLWENKEKIVKYKNDTIDQILKKNEAITDDSEEFEIEIATNKKQQEDLHNNTVSLNASTVATLFNEEGYDLDKIRRGEKVRPFYITLLPKDLSSIESIQERKELFIKIVLPLILHENKKIIKDRKKLFNVLAKKVNNKQETRWLKSKFKQYKIDNSEISKLKIRMDIIPVSLAIAQAAIESGWGTSRFALQGNALYGQWTWSSNGIEPLDKDASSSHKIMVFKVLRASVKAYKKNLNTHSGYQEFREARADLRIQGQEVTGLKLTKYLDKYAATGKVYTKKLELTIKENSLSDFDNAKLLSVGLRKGINL